MVVVGLTSIKLLSNFLFYLKSQFTPYSVSVSYHFTSVGESGVHWDMGYIGTGVLLAKLFVQSDSFYNFL